MKANRYCTIAALAVAAVLVLPALASAHPSVYSDVARIDTNAAPGPFTLANQTRHVVTNHGFTMVLRETNGATVNGVMDYSTLPGDYRATLTPSQRLAEGDTAAQPHATCRGVAALQDEAAIIAWQAPDDPFYNYIPFQSTSAGLEDHPEAWIDDVLALTDVDLATAGDLPAACAGLGGTYVPADEMQTSTASLNSGYAHLLTEPLNAQILELQTAQVQMQSVVESENQALKAEIRQLKLEATPLRVEALGKQSASALAASGASIKLRGPAGKSVKVQLKVRWAAAGALGLSTRVLGDATGQIGSDGTAAITVKPSARAAAALGKLEKARKLVAAAASGDRAAVSVGTLSP